MAAGGAAGSAWSDGSAQPHVLRPARGVPGDASGHRGGDHRGRLTTSVPATADARTAGGDARSPRQHHPGGRRTHRGGGRPRRGVRGRRHRASAAGLAGRPALARTGRAGPRRSRRRRHRSPVRAARAERGIPGARQRARRRIAAGEDLRPRCVGRTTPDLDLVVVVESRGDPGVRRTPAPGGARGIRDAVRRTPGRAGDAGGRGRAWRQAGTRCSWSPPAMRNRWPGSIPPWSTTPCSPGSGNWMPACSTSGSRTGPWTASGSRSTPTAPPPSATSRRRRCPPTDAALRADRAAAPGLDRAPRRSRAGGGHRPRRARRRCDRGDAALPATGGARPCHAARRPGPGLGPRRPAETRLGCRRRRAAQARTDPPGDVGLDRHARGDRPRRLCGDLGGRQRRAREPDRRVQGRGPDLAGARAGALADGGRGTGVRDDRRLHQARPVRARW